VARFNNAWLDAIQQVRKCNRKLYKGIRSHIKNTAERVIKGFQRFDKVLWTNIECFGSYGELGEKEA